MERGIRQAGKTEITYHVPERARENNTAVVEIRISVISPSCYAPEACPDRGPIRTGDAVHPRNDLDLLGPAAVGLAVDTMPRSHNTPGAYEPAGSTEARVVRHGDDQLTNPAPRNRGRRRYLNPVIMPADSFRCEKF